MAPDVTPPAALIAYRVSETNDALDQISVHFSEPVETNIAGQIENYILRNPDGTVAAAILAVSVNGSNVMLETAPLLDGAYTLSVSNLLGQAVR